MKSQKKRLKKGFSSGTAVVAGVIGAIRKLLDISDSSSSCSTFWVAVKLPIGFYLPVKVSVLSVDRSNMKAAVEVRKDGGDDPDVTHGAIFRTEVELFRSPKKKGIFIEVGYGIGIVTREGLPVKVGEPAINPVPRTMLIENVERTLCNGNLCNLPDFTVQELEDSLFLPYNETRSSLPSVYVKISVPNGKKLALRTLNPRLGITGGISILGTTGIVTPFSHEAFRETITTAMKFAKNNKCNTVVLSTGGKSERFAKNILSTLPDEAFIQIADFFKFSVTEAQKFGFREVIHALFFGKTLKMALGYPYTHAHSSELNLRKLVENHLSGIPDDLADEIKKANTARHVLDVLKARGRTDIIKKIAEIALKKSREFGPEIPKIALLLFDYDGDLICSMENRKNDD